MGLGLNREGMLGARRCLVPGKLPCDESRLGARAGVPGVEQALCPASCPLGPRSRMLREVGSRAHQAAKQTGSPPTYLALCTPLLPDVQKDTNNI